MKWFSKEPSIRDTMHKYIYAQMHIAEPHYTVPSECNLKRYNSKN